MAASIIPTFNHTYYSVQQHQDHPSSYCTLQWRRGQLLVKSPGQVQQPYLAALDTEPSLVECLKHSPIDLVRVDPKLGEGRLMLWANACLQAKKPIFLHIPSSNKMLKPGRSLLWWLKRLTHWIAALVLLLIVSPVMLGLVLLIRVYCPGSLFSRAWHIGERGRLFQSIKFRTTTVAKEALMKKDEKNMTTVGRWMRKYGLDNLPLLLNVLRGEMSLTGLRCWALEEAVGMSPEQQRQLNKQPGMISLWEVEAESNLLHLDSQAL